MSALDWMKSNAEALEVETLEVDAACAAEDGIRPGTYYVHTLVFRGRLPGAMKARLKRELKKRGGDQFWALGYEAVRLDPKSDLVQYTHCSYEFAG